MALYITKSSSGEDKKFNKMIDAYYETKKDNNVWFIQNGDNHWFKCVKGDTTESVYAVHNYRKNKCYLNGKNGDIFWSNEKKYTVDDLKNEKEYKEYLGKIKDLMKICSDKSEINDSQRNLDFYRTKFSNFIESKMKKKRVFLSLLTDNDFKNYCSNK